MGKLSDNIKRVLYRSLSLENYLRTVSGAYFAGYRMGLGKNSSVYEYPRFLKHLVRRGDTVIDIGANLGYYSRILSGLAGPEGKVYAVEPVRPILGVLERNLKRCRNVEIMPYALGSENRTVLLGNDSPRYAGYMGTGRNYVADGGQARPEIEFSAEMRRGSELFAGLERLDFVKCDIEGYETVVMRDMLPLVGKFMPVVLIETGGPNRKKILDMFRELGYAGYVLKEGRLVSLMREGEKDIVFIPGGRHGGFGRLIGSAGPARDGMAAEEKD